MLRRSLPALATVSLTLVAAFSSAATLWLEADPPSPAAGDEVTVRLLLGEGFSGEERAMDDAVSSFQRLRKNGRENLAREAGNAPVARYSAGDDGVEIVSLTWDGKTSGYYCKLVQVVGDARPEHPLRFSELGQRLEIVPQTDPVALASGGGRLQVQVLYEREPLAGVRLLAMPKSAPSEHAVSTVSDEIGLASFDLAVGGTWLVEVAYKRDGERSRATLVLAAGTP